MEIQLSEEIASDYRAQVQHIFADEEFLSLNQFVHHYWTNRLMHSISVSYLAWKIARKLGCDEKTAARAGLLHDFCPYDFKKKTPTGEHQLFFHPKEAAKNSMKKFEISEKEFDAILTHMFPLGPIPKHREAWIIVLADKICATMEFFRIKWKTPHSIIVMD